MIEINLLPEELKKFKGKVGISKEQLWYIVPILIGILLVLHLYFALAFLIKGLQYRLLNKRWLSNQTVFEKVEAWKKEYNLSSQDSQEALKLIQTRIAFSDKLKAMSDVLPDGIWFNRLSIKQKDFFLEGSAVSLKDEHMSLIRQFLDGLKNNNTFSKDFTGLELGPVSLREFKGYQIMDFSLKGNLK